jgi:hypothetical protein
VSPVALAALLKVVLLVVWLAGLLVLYRAGTPRRAIGWLAAFASLHVVFYVLPLPRPWALLEGGDRSYDTALAMAIFAGNPWLDDSVYRFAGVLSPLLPMMVAAAGFVTRIPVPMLDAYSPIIYTAVLPPAVYWFWLRAFPVPDAERDERRWEAVVMAFSVLFLTTVPTPLLSTGGADFWQLGILLKPSHAATYLLALPLFWTLVRPGRTSAAIVIGGVILAVSIVCYIASTVIIMASFGFYALVLAITRHGPPLQSVLARVTGIGVLGLVGSSWYWMVFLREYSPAHGSAIWQTVPRYMPTLRLMIFDPFESTLLMNQVFWFGLLGVVRMWRRRSAPDVVLLSLLASTIAIKAAYVFAYAALGFGTQYGELQYWSRFLWGLSAGVGIVWILSLLLEHRHAVRAFLRSAPLVRRLAWATSGMRAMVIATFLVFIPVMEPFWEFPPVMDYRWRESSVPIAADVTAATAWIRTHTAPSDVFAAERAMSVWIPVFSGRKVLFDDVRGVERGWHPMPVKLARREAQGTLYGSADAAAVTQALKRYDVRYVVVDTASSEAAGIVRRFEGVFAFPRVYEGGTLTIYKIPG